MPFIENNLCCCFATVAVAYATRHSILMTVNYAGIIVAESTSGNLEPTVDLGLQEFRIF